MRRFVVALALVLSIPAAASTYTVDDPGDAPDFLPGDDVCSTALAGGVFTLRAAIQEACRVIEEREDRFERRWAPTLAGRSAGSVVGALPPGADDAVFEFMMNGLRLTRGVAHEVKNPLNAMAIHLDLLKAKAQGPGVESHLDVMRREIDRLDRVVTAFLDFTRPVEVRLRPASLGDVAAGVRDLLAADAATQGVRIEVDARDLPPLWIDRDLVEQALLNLVNNSLQAMVETQQSSNGAARRPLDGNDTGSPPLPRRESSADGRENARAPRALRVRAAACDGPRSRPRRAA